MWHNNYTIVDVETTGSNPVTHRVIEIGILRIERGELVQKYKSFINPQQPVPDFISEFTGISDRQVRKAPLFEDLAEDVLALFEDSIFVAHNSNFDYKFLQHEFRRAGLAFTMPTMCTVRLSRTLFPKYKKHNLSAIIERFNFTCSHRHRAFDDAHVLWDFLKQLERDFDKDVLETAINRTMGKVAPKKQQAMPAVHEPVIEYVAED